MGQMSSSPSKKAAVAASSSSSSSYLADMAAPTDVEIPVLFVHPLGTRQVAKHRHRWRPDALNRTSSLLLAANAPADIAAELADARAHLRSRSVSRRELHAVGAQVALVVGDALGAPLEFRALSYDAAATPRVAGFDAAVWRTPGCNKFGLLPGQWTDDASMSLALAESLLAHGALHPHDLRLRFLLWWHLGYCNAFGYDAQRLHGGSVGLGGNIGASFEEFLHKETRFTGAGDRNTSGNGSLMRLAPVATLFAKAPKRESPADRDARYEAAMYVAYWQSKTTHQGDEAAECCRLMTFVLLSLIDAAERGESAKDVLAALPGTFTTPLYSVRCLAASLCEERCAANASAELKDRDWNWRADKYRFSPTRARMQPGYIGSYCMDALAMALHCAWATDSLPAAMLKCANLRGDSDTTTAITAQIVGAMYGFDAIPGDWLSHVEQWDPHGLVLLRAVRLYNCERQAQERFDDDAPESSPPATFDASGSYDNGNDEDDVDDDDDDDDDDDASDDKTVEIGAAKVQSGVTEDGVQFFAVEPVECEHADACSITVDDVERAKSRIVARHCAEPACTAVTDEQWFCLTCGESRCGRFFNKHALAHSDTAKHAVALSFADLSVWCYPCEKYVKAQPIEPVLALFRSIKFGGDN